RNCFKRLLVHGGQNEMRSRDQRLTSLATHFKIQSHRLRAKASNPNADFQNIIQPRRAMKITLEMHARQPDLQLVKHHSIMQPDSTKQLRLSKLEEVNVSAVENNARGVDIAPPHALFNREFLVVRHSNYECDKK